MVSSIELVVKFLVDINDTWWCEENSYDHQIKIVWMECDVA
jgi:hypothetical protein